MLDKMTEVEEAKLHMQLLHEALKTKTEPAEYVPPELIAIDQDDYHAEHVGNATAANSF
jgi:hypothetical protein